MTFATSKTRRGLRSAARHRQQKCKRNSVRRRERRVPPIGEIEKYQDPVILGTVNVDVVRRAKKTWAEARLATDPGDFTAPFFAHPREH